MALDDEMLRRGRFGSTPFKGEKATNWEGGFRVPTCIRWPGVIKPGTVHNGMCAHEDLVPTFAAAAMPARTGRSPPR